MTSVSLSWMGPLPGGPLSRRHAPAATLPGAGRHNRVSWAGITLPSPARPGPRGGPGASEPVRLAPGRGAAGGHGGAAQLALDTSWPEDPAPLCQAWTLTPAHLRALLHPAAFPREAKCLASVNLLILVLVVSPGSPRERRPSFLPADGLAAWRLGQGEGVFSLLGTRIFGHLDRNIKVDKSGPSFPVFSEACEGEGVGDGG